MPGSGNETVEWGWIMFSPQKPADLKETFDKQPLSLSKVAFFSTQVEQTMRKSNWRMKPQGSGWKIKIFETTQLCN